MSEDKTSVRVDIVSDVVCPWCAIGYYQLAAASRETGITLDIRWHPFELNPQMAPEGENLREHLAAKYGTTPEGSRKARANLTALGAELGFTFNYADNMRMYNTFKAHQLIDWAKEHEKAHETKLALFEAFFTERRNISDIGVLADVASQVGLKAYDARQVLESGERATKVRLHEKHWTDRGVTGVPAMVFDEKYMAAGSQGVENYMRILEKVANERSSETVA